MIQTFSNAGIKFEVPSGYQWVVRKGIIGYDGQSPVEPWHLLDDDACRSLSEIWPGGPSLNPLVTFGKRQDNDDYACFEISESAVIGYVVIHGWTASGYDIIHRFESVWDWLKHVIDDVREWQELG